jgi:hypothetical protein
MTVMDLRLRFVISVLILLASSAAASSARRGCDEPGDSQFVYPVGNLIKFCGDQRADYTCAKYLCTRCQANGNWSEDYVCSKPDRVRRGEPH